MAAQPGRPAQQPPAPTRCHSVPIRRARTATPRCRIRRASRGQMLKGLTTATGDQAFELCPLASCLWAAEEYLADVVGRRLDRTPALCRVIFDRLRLRPHNACSGAARTASQPTGTGAHIGGYRASRASPLVTIRDNIPAPITVRWTPAD